MACSPPGGRRPPCLPPPLPPPRPQLLVLLVLLATAAPIANCQGGLRRLHGSCTGKPNNSSCGASKLCLSGVCTAVCYGYPAWDPAFSCSPAFTPAGKTCIAPCDAGFRGRLTARCGATGQWAITGSCLPIMCSGAPPSVPLNMRFDCPPTGVGVSCRGKCLPGLEGSPSAACLPSGGFGRVSGACTPTHTMCTGNPPAPGNASFACGQRTPAGRNCTGSCNPGYVPSAASGPPTAACTPAGTWSAVSGGCDRAGVCLLSPPSFQGSSFVCGLPSPVDIGQAFGCALKADTGRLVCFSFDGTGYASALLEAMPPELDSGVASFSVGLSHACAVMAGAGRVVCFGADDSGQASPPLEAQSGVSGVSAGGCHSCAVKRGSVLCWGARQPSQAGAADVPPEARLGDVLSVSAGSSAFTCALRSGGRVVCWGQGPQARPPDAVRAGGAAAVSAGGEAACALLTAGAGSPWAAVSCWGDDTHSVVSGAQGVAERGVVGLSVGSAHACLLLADSAYGSGVGRVRCFGGDWAGQSMLQGQGTWGFARAPGDWYLTQGDVVAVAAGGDRTCVATRSGRVVCTAAPGPVALPGELLDGGVGAPVSSAGATAAGALCAAAPSPGFFAEAAPLAVCTPDGWRTAAEGAVRPRNTSLVAAGWASFGCAVRSDGVGASGSNVSCWGAISDLGSPNEVTTVPENVTALLRAEGGVGALRAGGFACATAAATGRLACFGSRYWHAAGLAVPPELSDGGGVSDLSVGPWHACAVRGPTSAAPGSVLCWGSGDVGEASVPGAAASGGIVAVRAGSAHTLALNASGAVLCWGAAWRCELPAELAGGALNAGVSAIATGEAMSCALKGGRLICWGPGTLLAVPDEVGAAAVLDFGVGYDFACALLGDGCVLCWTRPGVTSQYVRAVPAEAQSGVEALSVGRSMVCALRRVPGGAGGGRQAVCFGGNLDGELATMPAGV